MSGRLLIYAEIACPAVGGNDELGIELDDGTDIYELSLGVGLVAGDVRLNNVTNRDSLYSAGTGYVKYLILIDRTTHLLEVWLYDTMQVIQSAVIAEFGASSALQVRVGVFNRLGTGSGTIYIRNYPAFALIDKIPEP
jgi:hypothetical protein